MAFWERLLGRSGPDPREQLRPLWHRVVEIAREPGFYRDMGVVDSVAGRFDMITVVLGTVLLRLEAEGGLEAETTLLTELFVQDMDGQLRETGVGDVVVGKHVGKLASSLGGRWGALREAFASDSNAALEAALNRNVSFSEDEADAAPLATALRHLRSQLMSLRADAVLAGSIPR